MERLEGKQCIKAALLARQRKIEVVLVSSNAHHDKTEEVLSLARLQGIPIKVVSPEELNAAAQGRTHGGLVAICSPKPLMPVDEVFRIIKKVTGSSFLLLLEGVEDEQNLGFIIRSAGAMGVNAVLLKKHIWNFDPIAVSRASAGAYEYLPLIKIEKSDDILTPLRKSGIKIYGAISNARKTIYEINLTVGILIALGGEKRGLSADVRDRCDGFFSIPMPDSNRFKTSKDDKIESLSLSHSAAIIMAESMRQRFYTLT